MADETTPEETEETPAAAEQTTGVVEETTPEAPAAEPEPAAAAERAAAEPEAAAEPAAAEPEAAEPVTADEPAAAPAAGDAPAAEAAPHAVSGPKKPRKRLPRSLRHTHAKPKRETGGARKAITRLPKPESEPGRRQERRGIVVSDKGDKTIVVKVDLIRAHPKYKKVVRRSRKFHAHDEGNTAGIGDVVRIVETRPLSKLKNWRLAEIVEKAR